MGSTSEDGSNNYVEKGYLPRYVAYANKFVNSILADVYEETEKIEIVTKSIIIVKHDIEEIAKDQLYKNKEVLKTTLSMYVIKIIFQYRVA